MNFKKMLAGALIAVFAAISIAQAAGPAYPINTPTYIPSAVSQPQAFTAPGNYTYQVSGISTVTVRITGTCTNLAATLQGSNDGTNWTALPLMRVADNVPVSGISAAGFWRASTAGLSAARVNISALSATCTVAMAGTQSPVVVTNSTISGDPCLNPALAKTATAVNIGTATDTELAALTATQKVHVCSVSLSASGTSPTFTFKTGTGTACGTGTASLTGAIVPSATVGTYNVSGSGTLFSGATSGALCVTTGATTSIQGFVTYVKQ
jgi:hypothetical protein